MPNILIENNFYQGTSQACIVDLTPPTFAGINFLDVESRGQIRAGWSAATDATPPIRYEVYIKASTATGLFNTTNIIAVTPNLQYDIFTLPDGSFLQNGVTYYVGVRAIDGVNNRDSNTVSMSVISTGVLTSIDVYETHAAWSIDTSNQFRITMWANKNDSLAKSPNGVLGTASYQVFDKAGNAVVGMSGSSISANSEGLYVASAVANLLTESSEHYEVKVTIIVDGEARTNIIPLMEERAQYKLGGLFFINVEDDFDGIFWVSKDEVIKTTGLGTGSYQVYDHDGDPIIGMSQTGIVADVNGIYKITHIPSLLEEDYPGYSVKITVVVDGVTRSQMVSHTVEQVEYKPKAQFSINASNQLQATFWLEYDSNVETSSLGTANYTVYDVNGNAVVGLTQSGITPDINGRFHITPVSAALLTDLTHYSVKVGIVAHGVERIAYKGFTLLGT
jgi:hypothetical protein